MRVNLCVVYFCNGHLMTLCQRFKDRRIFTKVFLTYVNSTRCTTKLYVSLINDISSFNCIGRGVLIERGSFSTQSYKLVQLHLITRHNCIFSTAMYSIGKKETNMEDKEYKENYTGFVKFI